MKDHKRWKKGHRIRLWCSQDEARKKAAKPSDRPGAKHRDYVGMKRYPCKSRLSVTYRGNPSFMVVNLHHHSKHIDYFDVSMPPDAFEMIHGQVEWLTPSAMAVKVRSAFPDLTTAQIYNTWRTLSEAFWWCAEDQLESAKKLLAEFGDEVDVFELSGVPEGVELLGWGMAKIAGPLKGKVVEVGMDATCRCFLQASRSVFDFKQIIRMRSTSSCIASWVNTTMQDFHFHIVCFPQQPLLTKGNGRNPCRLG